ncbi:hypothetical protein [Roseospira goensis]|uniref:Glycosylase n=1 Tax=Roseospira goensis TaxID=391922 RepID=A0A7W6RWT4_9PROT|nr:hypothetical protein [Roseospira goensis]MBB4284617.1 hypothetical protein [Roseospira goensis]
MRWRKLGRVFVPDPRSWMHSYAQTPTPLAVGDRIRVFLGCRPRARVEGLPVARVAFVDLDRSKPTRVVDVHDGPVLNLGETGSFDEFGQHPITAMWRGGEVWLYYVGWTRMVSVPFNRAIGLAISTDGGRSFRRYGRGPIMGPTPREPFLHQGPAVRRFEDRWHMWYLGGLRWVSDGGRPEAIYQVMHATSDDGIAWRREGVPILPTVFADECQAGQAVIHRGGLYHIWFSYRPGLDFRNAARGYRMGYACSADLATWSRDDAQAGLDVSAAGWDSEMVGYPNILEDGAHTWLFYCGNYFGRDGFGVAEMVEGEDPSPGTLGGMKRQVT